MSKEKIELTEEELKELDLQISEKYRYINNIEDEIRRIKIETGLAEAKKKLQKMCEDYKNKSRQE